MTTRQMMIGVAIIALLSGIGLLCHRMMHFRRLAAYHALQESSVKPPERDHGSELLDLRWEIADWQRKTESYRPEQVQAQHLLDAKIAAGLSTQRTLVYSRQ